MNLVLPFVESMLSLADENVDFSHVYVVGVQHVVETLHAMFRSFFRRGLKPENIKILGKCYSTNIEVYEEMVADGIDVDTNSFKYSSHTGFDRDFGFSVDQFFEEKIQPLLACKKKKKIIVLDDGGRLLGLFSGSCVDEVEIIGVEQTSAGYNAIKNKKVPFPVINVARSPIKLKYESPLISKAAIERVNLAFRELSFPEKCLVLGGGVIGNAVYSDLSSKLTCEIYDLSRDKSSVSQPLTDLLGKYDCIVGCTGTVSVSHRLHKHIKPGTALVSVSSSDREFDAVYLRRQISENKNCHKDLSIGGIYLVNSGFPVNFDGERENIDPNLIQLTLALIASAIIYGVSKNKPTNKGIVPLPKIFESKIETLYQELELTNRECFSSLPNS